jgi:hypothetical protein
MRMSGRLTTPPCSRFALGGNSTAGMAERPVC